MKNIVTTICAILLASFGVTFAQSPTTTYPYLYPHFTEGKIIMKGGNEEVRQMNLHLRRDMLHYIDNGVIKEALLKDVTAVEIGKDVFIPLFGKMMRVEAKDNFGCVVAEILGDFESAREAEGAYGVSSTSSATMKVTSIQTDSQVNQNYMNILNEKDSGAELNTKTTYYLVTPLYKVEASKADVQEALPAEKTSAWKAFQKENKIKWKEPQSLLQVVDFLNKQ